MTETISNRWAASCAAHISYLAGVTVLAIRLELGALVHVARDLRVGDFQGRIGGLGQTATLLLQSQGSGLRETWVGNLVVENVHNLPEILAGHVRTVDGLHNPTALHARREGLALGVPWVPRLRDHLHGHGALTAAARLVTQDAEGALLVRRCSRRASGRGGSEGHVRIFRPTTLQVLRAHPCHETTAALAYSPG